MLNGRAGALNLAIQNPFKASENSLSFREADALSSTQTDSTTNTEPTSTLNIQHTTTQNYSQKQLDSLLQIAERRERYIYYQSQIKETAPDSIKQVTDTQSVKYSLYNYPFTEPKAPSQSNDNFLLLIAKNNNATQTIQKDSVKHAPVAAQTKITQPSPYFEGKVRNNLNMDGLTIAIVVSLFLLAIMKVTYNKFIVQIISGLVNFQVAMRLFRERNVLFRNISIGLNAVFYINTGLFIYFILDAFSLTQLYTQVFRNILAYGFIVFLVNNIKTLVNKTIGYIFMAQDEFAEYIHNITLFNKNIGLFLFPIIVLYPFVLDNIKPFVTYFGIVIISIILLLRFYRGFQIIMRKGISIFYLILYLCAIEILPVLIMVKLTYTLI